MQNDLNLSPDQMNALLGMASKKMGADPQRLKQQMESGQTDALLSALPADKQAQISALLQNPKAIEQMMQNPLVKQLLKGLMNQ